MMSPSLLTFVASLSLAYANDYSLALLDPRCAVKSDAGACSSEGVGCVFANNTCVFDRSRTCSSNWGASYKAGLLGSLSCGATDQDKCPSTCQDAAAKMYAAVRVHENLAEFISYNGLYVAMGGWTPQQRTAVEVDFALCASEITTQQLLSQSKFGADACDMPDTVLKTAYSNAIEGKVTQGQAATATSIPLAIPIVATSFLIVLAMHAIF